MRHPLTNEQIHVLKENISKDNLLPEDGVLWMCAAAGLRLNESITLTYLDFGRFNRKIKPHQVYVHSALTNTLIAGVTGITDLKGHDIDLKDQSLMCAEKASHFRIRPYTKTIVPRHIVISSATEDMIVRLWEKAGKPNLKNYVFANNEGPAGVISPVRVQRRLKTVLGIRHTRDLRYDHCYQAIKAAPQNGVHEMTKLTGHINDYRTKTNYAGVEASDLKLFRDEFDRMVGRL